MTYRLKPVGCFERKRSLRLEVIWILGWIRKKVAEKTHLPQDSLFLPRFNTKNSPDCVKNIQKILGSFVIEKIQLLLHHIFAKIFYQKIYFFLLFWVKFKNIFSPIDFLFWKFSFLIAVHFENLLLNRFIIISQCY